MQNTKNNNEKGIEKEEVKNDVLSNFALQEIFLAKQRQDLQEIVNLQGNPIKTTSLVDITSKFANREGVERLIGNFTLAINENREVVPPSCCYFFFDARRKDLENSLLLQAKTTVEGSNITIEVKDKIKMQFLNCKLPAAAKNVFLNVGIRAYIYGVPFLKYRIKDVNSYRFYGFYISRAGTISAKTI